MFPSRIAAPASRTSSGCRLLTLAFVPTGMNAGVGTSPWAVRRMPARAAPSVAVTSKTVTTTAPFRGTPAHHPLRA